jgi:hypothetical protein
VRITKFIFVVAVSSGLAACATKSEPGNSGQDGFHLYGGGPVSNTDLQKMKDQLVKNAKSSTAKAGVREALDNEPLPGTVVIGNVGSLRRVDANALLDMYTKAYVVGAEKWHPGKPPVMAEADFTSRVAGYTSVVLWSVPGVVASRRTVTVLEADVDGIDFPGQRAASFWGTTGDLVVARQNDDGMFFVSHVLCKKSASEYGNCEQQFARGLFDKNSGEELGNDRAPKNGGARIDVMTYKVIPKV